MQLFILGPAFGLPSIDAECNAAVALLQLRARNRFELRPTHKDADRLPLLIDGTARLWGFKNIARHLSDKRICDEHRTIDAAQRANAVAIAAFIEAHANLLLDISLYVSFDNYRNSTRSAFTKILPWHANYIIPARRRGAARNRTEHLGIHSIDVDDVHEDLSNKPPGLEGVGKEQSMGAMQKRTSLLLNHKNTLMGMLQRPEHAAVFKLHALADNFFGPLQDIIQSSSHLLGTDEPTAVDCLLFGYLSLALYPQLPQNWLAATLRHKYKNLAAYTERLFHDFGLSTNAANVMLLSKSKTSAQAREAREALGLSLKWLPSEGSMLLETLDDTAAAVLDHVPYFSSMSQLHLWYAPSPPLWEQLLPPVLFTTSAALAITAYIALRRGWITSPVWPRGQAIHVFGRRRFSELGDLGNALAGAFLPASP